MSFVFSYLCVFDYVLPQFKENNICYLNIFLNNDTLFCFQIIFSDNDLKLCLEICVN